MVQLMLLVSPIYQVDCPAAGGLTIDTAPLTVNVGVSAYVFDAHTAGVYGGALGFVTRRVMVAEDDLAPARRVLAECRREARQ